MFASFNDFYINVINKKRFMLSIFFAVIFTYGFSIMNRTISIDDLARDLYVGSGQSMLMATRWGTVLWHKLTITTELIPGVDKLLAVTFLIFASFLFCGLLYYENNKKTNLIGYTLLSVFFITYPLYNEIFEYNGANMITAGNFCIVFATIYYLNAEKNFKTILLSGMLLSIVASSYETGIFVYISVVLILLFYKYCILQKELKHKFYWITEGLQFSIPLFIAVFLRIVVGLLIIRVLNLEYAPNGATGIVWQLNYAFVISLIKSFIIKYLLNGLIYYPISLFVFSCIVFIVIIIYLVLKQRKLLPLLLGLFIVISLFFQLIIQGSVIPYRNAHTLPIFISFIMYIVIELSELINRKKILKNIILISTCYLAYAQCVTTNKLLALNNQRSDNEAAIIQQLGFKLKSEFSDKPVIFVGEQYLGSWINNQITVNSNSIGGRIYLTLTNHDSGTYKYLETNVNSLILWSRYAYSQKMMEKYFAYYGYDIKVVSIEIENVSKKLNY